MREKVIKIISLTVVIVFFMLVTLFFNGDIGIPKSGLEKDARDSSSIQDDWCIEKSVSDTMAAFIAYPEDKSDVFFSVYVNRPGLSFGYFFRGGGSISVIEQSIYEFTIEGYMERGFLSMNAQKVARLEIDDGNSVQVIEIDSNKPFALVLPHNIGELTFYDVDGTIVEVHKGIL